MPHSSDPAPQIGPDNVSIVLAKRPSGEIIPEETFERKVTPAPQEKDLKDGQVIVELLYASVDPAMRPRLNDVRSYVPPLQIGEHMAGPAAVRVVASRRPDVEVGSIALARSGWTQYAVLSPGEYVPAAELHTKDPVELVHLAGLTSLTAWVGIKKLAQVKEGDLVVISGAAGATGSMAGQIARILGARKVVGIAGGPEKCEWVKSIGFDVALDYKSADFKKRFEEETEGFIDVYYDNVGGEILDMALAKAQYHARFIMCGAISQYNLPPEKRYGIKNLVNVVMMRIQMKGFIVGDHAADFPQARKELVEWNRAGKLELRQTIVPGGIGKLPQALADLLKGGNTGKMMVEVKKL
jgi:NADPH-dependent curcumin reductase CurA